MLSNAIPHDMDSMSRAMASLQRIQTHLADVTMAGEYRSAMTRISLSPFMFDIETYRAMAVFHEALVKGVRAAVQQWSTNAALRAHLPVHPRIERILKNAPDEHFNIGTLRPDVLFDKHGSFQVCEINGRFPLNCFITVALLNNGMHKESMQRDSILAERNICSLSSVTSFLANLKNRIAGHADVVFLLHGREEMHDIAMVEHAISVRVRHCSPAQLALTASPENGLHFKEQDGSLTPIRSCIIELHQDEFLEIPDDILDALAALSFKGHAMNDFRTVFLAHNKSILYVLRSDILNLDPETAAVLRKHIVPTIPAQYVTNAFKGFDFSSLLLKPGSLGKSDGIILQKNMTDEKFFEQVISKSVESPHVVQAYVEPYRFDIVDNECNIRQMTAVGIISSLDGIFYGPGLVRSSVGDVSSITGGGICSMPAMFLVNVPACVRSFCNGLLKADSNLVKTALIEHGVALVGSGAPVHDGEELLKFLKEGLSAKFRTQRDSDSALWHMRSTHNLESWYTMSRRATQCKKCSQDSLYADLPRFVAMAVVHADRMGGGLLSLVRFTDAFAQLPMKHVEVLEKIDPKWELLHDWEISGTEHVMKPFFIALCRACFRPDNLSLNHFRIENIAKLRKALHAFQEILERIWKKNEMILPERSVIIIDSRRFAHGTTEVQDAERYLHLVRFDLPCVFGDGER